MKRIRIYSPGSYDKLIIEKNLPIPKVRNDLIPGKGEVLVRTHAVGVNYADVCVRMGLYSSAKKYVGWPITPGFEFSGTVLEIGPDDENRHVELSSTENNNNMKVDILKKRGIEVGSQVFGVSRFDGYSTHVVVPRHQLLALPKSLSMEEAAAMPAVFFTAYYAMFELGHPRPGYNILVHSAAGGVGGALVQLGKLAGANVVAVVGASHKVAAVRQLGADHIIDKTTQNLWQECEKICPDGFDLVFDANGVETMKQSYTHLTTGGGKLVIYGFHSMLPRQGGTPNWFKMAWDWLWTPTFNPLQMTSDNKSVLAFNLSYLFHKVELFTEMMDRLVQLFEEGKLKSSKITSYTLDEVAEAHKAIESGKTIGKLILLTGDE